MNYMYIFLYYRRILNACWPDRLYCKCTLWKITWENLCSQPVCPVRMDGRHHLIFLNRGDGIARSRNRRAKGNCKLCSCQRSNGLFLRNACDSICVQARGLASIITRILLYSYRERLLYFFKQFFPNAGNQQFFVSSLSYLRGFRLIYDNSPFYDVISETSLLLESRWIRTCLHGESRRAHPAKVTRYELGHVRKSILTPDRRIAIIFHLCRLDEQIDFRCQTCRQSRQVWGSLICCRYDSIPVIFPQEWHRILSILFHMVLIEI